MFSYFSREESDYEIETAAAWRDKIAVPMPSPCHGHSIFVEFVHQQTGI